MSSVARTFKQTPSNFFWSHGADIWTLNAIKAVFNGNVGSYSGPEPEYIGSLILFDTEVHFAEATYELLNNVSNTFYADSYNTHRDMGQTLYIGVKGGESKILTMGLLKINGTENVGYGLTSMNLSAYVDDYYDGDIDVDLIRGAF